MSCFFAKNTSYATIVDLSILVRVAPNMPPFACTTSTVLGLSLFNYTLLQDATVFPGGSITKFNTNSLLLTNVINELKLSASRHICSIINLPQGVQCILQFLRKHRVLPFVNYTLYYNGVLTCQPFCFEVSEGNNLIIIYH